MLLGYTVYEGTLEDVDWTTNKVINTINPHSYCVAKTDVDFRVALKESDILLPDGIGIVWASKILNKSILRKIAGFDLFIHLMKRANETGGKCFFLGASEQTLDLIKERGKYDFPNIIFGSYSPPFKSSFSTEDSFQMCKEVNVFNPDILFIGMTAPKQEKWAHEYKDKLKVGNICCIGAVFDFYAGTVQRPGSFWIKMGLEWLPRFLKEPRRLAQRNLISTPKFIIEVLSRKLKWT